MCLETVQLPKDFHYILNNEIRLDSCKSVDSLIKWNCAHIWFWCMLFCMSFACLLRGCWSQKYQQFNVKNTLYKRFFLFMFRNERFSFFFFAPCLYANECKRCRSISLAVCQFLHFSLEYISFGAVTGTFGSNCCCHFLSIFVFYSMLHFWLLAKHILQNVIANVPGLVERTTSKTSKMSKTSNGARTPNKRNSKKKPYWRKETAVNVVVTLLLASYHIPSCTCLFHSKIVLLLLFAS